MAAAASVLTQSKRFGGCYEYKGTAKKNCKGFI
jgi:hypothetical protein